MFAKRWKLLFLPCTECLSESKRGGALGEDDGGKDNVVMAAAGMLREAAVRRRTPRAWHNTGLIEDASYRTDKLH